MRKLFATVLSCSVVLGACSERAPLATGPELEASYAAGGNGATSGNKLQCFSGTTDGGYNGTCALISNGATLNTIDGDEEPHNNYAGVYVEMSNLGGRPIGDVNKLAFTYSGSGAAGGSPRLSVPIDANGDGARDGFAFIDTNGCNTGSANVGTADAINDATCLVAYGTDSYPNWAAFVAANPTYRIASNSVSFIIADAPGTFTITNVQLGRGAAKSK